MTSGRLDVVISNAAAWSEEPFLEMKDESWLESIAVNLTASFASDSVPPGRWCQPARGA